MNIAHKWLKLKDHWSENKVCSRCGLIFQELKNAGRWECSWHPGRKVLKDETHRIYTSGASFASPTHAWSCCGRHWSARHESGCVPCDHTMGRIELDETDVIPNIHSGWLKDLKCTAGSIVKDPDSGWVTIKRTK